MSSSPAASSRAGVRLARVAGRAPRGTHARSTATAAASAPALGPAARSISSSPSAWRATTPPTPPASAAEPANRARRRQPVRPGRARRWRTRSFTALRLGVVAGPAGPWSAVNVLTSCRRRKVADRLGPARRLRAGRRGRRRPDRTSSRRGLRPSPPVGQRGLRRGARGHASWTASSARAGMLLILFGRRACRPGPLPRRPASSGRSQEL